jgi:tetratricopeptide (TPR) repeat protein
VRLFSRLARLCAGVLLSGALAGCAGTPQLAALRQAPPALPPRVELTTVPFFPQETHQCGPASLATALKASGVAVSPDALTPQVYLPERQGSLQVEMLATTRRHGLVAYPLAPSLRDLLEEIAGGTPVVVLQNLGLAALPLWHYAVAVGYDLEQETVILRSGLTAREVMPLTTFEHTWARSGYWAMLALPPTRLPKSAAENPYVQAAAALEQARQPQAAEVAYRTALQRWPKNLTARMGLGNTAYASGRLKEAEAAFRQAAADHPQEWMPLNNLALAVAEQKRFGDALKVAEQAVALAGNRREAQETLQEIRRKAKNQ